jgi:Na+/H+-dicarboxylate symporter
VLRLPLPIQILLALALAIICGQLTRLGIGWENFGFVSFLGLPVAEVYRFVGQLFLRALQMLVVPLIAAAVITGLANLGGEKAFWRLGSKTAGYYLLTSLLAILTGLFLVNWWQPGKLPEEVSGQVFGLEASPEEMAARIGDRGASDVVGIFQRMIPVNIFETASQNSQMLGLLFFSVLFGYFLGQLDSPGAQTVRNFFSGLYDVMLAMTQLVMNVAPIGIFGLVAAVSSSTEPAQFLYLFGFFFCVVTALIIHAVVVLPLLVRGLGGVNPWAHARAMFPALLTAFSTSSSSATLPLTLRCLEERSGVSHRTASFVTPLGATVNMDGTALYECVAVLFLAQLYGVELSLAQQFLVVVLALATSIGVAGVPSASLVAIVVILGAVGLPLEGIGILLVFDRLLDMARTSVNVWSDACGAVIIARSEGEELPALRRSGA